MRPRSDASEIAAVDRHTWPWTRWPAPRARLRVTPPAEDDLSVRSLLWALSARCPLCGSGRIWRTFGQEVDRCPRCAFPFSREEGYWTGALIINIGVAMALFFLLFVGGMVVTWPEVPWTVLLVLTIVAMIAAPLLLYPQSKTVWLWLDLRFNPRKDSER